jgi:hypothetical protein
MQHIVNSVILTMPSPSAKLMSEQDNAVLPNLPPEQFECIVEHYVTMVGIQGIWESRRVCRMSNTANKPLLRAY